MTSVMSIEAGPSEASRDAVPVLRGAGGSRSARDRTGSPAGGSSARGTSSGAAEALKELLIEATLLHWHVAAASRALAADGDLTNAQVSVLRTLQADGSQTVPQLAAARGVARQPVQRSVDELAAQGLVRLTTNPRHKRSRLVTLTPAGRRRLTQMERRQSSWLRPMTDGLSERSLRTASTLLRRIRERIATRMTDTVPTRG